MIKVKLKHKLESLSLKYLSSFSREPDPVTFTFVASLSTTWQVGEMNGRTDG